MANTFYNRIIRKLVIGFGNMFNDITLVRYNPNLTEAERLIVPIIYGPKELYVFRNEEDSLLDKKVQVTLPRMSFEMTGFTYDASRKLNTNFKNFAQTNTGLVSQYNPVPYNFDFNLYIYVRNIEDGTQIIEHILPYFTPDYTIKLNLIPEMGIVKEVPIILNSTSQDIDYEGDYSRGTRNIIWTLNFTVKGFIFGKINDSSSGLITHSITSVLNKIGPEDVVLFNMNANSGFGNYQVGEIVYQGYSAGTATATGKVIIWNNNTLHLTNINGNFVSSVPIRSTSSSTNYTFASYSPTPETLARINVTPSPTDANVNTPHIINSEISEFPNIVSGELPDNFAGDAMLQVGEDDLHIQQQKTTDLQ
jgi:hypothetical protein